MEQPEFELQHVYRSLGSTLQRVEFIQSELYKSNLKICDRNKGILYYDCTNYFFETEQEDGLRQYGVSKEHRPNPIVQMGLFMDGDGFPLAFCINKGNTNEQVTLKPLEKKIISDFGLSKFVVCTDAGLASVANRKFNDIQGRAFRLLRSIQAEGISEMSTGSYWMENNLGSDVCIYGFELNVGQCLDSHSTKRNGSGKN